MRNIDLVKSLSDSDQFAKIILNSLPKGYLYSSSLKPFIIGFIETYKEFLQFLNISINDILSVNEQSLYLDEYLVMYGLPNPLFPVLQTNKDKVFAISMMMKVKDLRTELDFTNFLALFGYNVKFYSLNQSLVENSTFPYGFPITFSPSTTHKDKFTYLVWTEESSETLGEFFNLGDAFDLDFVEIENNALDVKRILDYLKPDYLIFEYINTTQKNLYNL